MGLCLVLICVNPKTRNRTGLPGGREQLLSGVGGHVRVCVEGRQSLCWGDPPQDGARCRELTSSGEGAQSSIEGHTRGGRSWAWHSVAQGPPCRPPTGPARAWAEREGKHGIKGHYKNLRATSRPWGPIKYGVAVEVEGTASCGWLDAQLGLPRS